MRQEMINAIFAYQNIGGVKNLVIMAFTILALYLFLRCIILRHICKEQMRVHPFLDPVLELSWKAIKRKLEKSGARVNFPFLPPHTQPTPIGLRGPFPKKVLGFCFSFFFFSFFLAGERGWEFKPTTTSSSLQAPPFIQQSV